MSSFSSSASHGIHIPILHNMVKKRVCACANKNYSAKIFEGATHRRRATVFHFNSPSPPKKINPLDLTWADDDPPSNIGYRAMEGRRGEAGD